MKFRTGLFPAIFVGVMSAVFVLPASAVIRVDLPVSGRFAFARTVIVGKVAAVDAEHRVVTVTTVERLKDDASPATFRIQFVAAADLMKAVAVGQPVVLLSKQKASVHIADTWLVAVPVADSNPPIFRVEQVDTAAAGKTFPGTTVSLVRVLQEMKAGKSTLLDTAEGKAFSGGVTEIAKLDVATPTAFVAADVNGDGKPDLIIATPAGMRLFLAGAAGFTDATEQWGLKGVNAASISAGSAKADGKIDLLLDGTLFRNDGLKFTATQAIKLDGGAKVVASALADFTGGGKLDAGFLLGDGRLVTFKNDGQYAAAWTKSIDRKLPLGADPVQSAVFGDFADAGPGVLIVQENSVAFFTGKNEAAGADFDRLTGDSLLKIKGFAGGLKNAVATSFDINGDHRPDLLITADGAAMVMINRGFGTFLPDSDAGTDLSAAVLKILPASLSGIRARAALSKGGNSPDDLLLLSDEGHLFLASNPAAAK